jgi:hypothetical protein
MTESDFTRWLQGWVELEKGKLPTAEQWKMITDHLKLVYTKVTPELGGKSAWEDKKVDAPTTMDDIIKEYSKIKLPAQPSPFIPSYPGVPIQPVQPFPPQPTWVGPSTDWGTGVKPASPGVVLC